MRTISIFRAASGSSLLLLAFITAGLAETYVGGEVGCQTWTKANSPFRVTSSLTVRVGCCLTIEPGVEVKFDSSYLTLTIYGCLQAVGTEAEPIRFTKHPNAYHGWYGINFHQCGPSLMEHCQVEQVVITRAIYLYQCSTNVVFRQCVFSDNDKAMWIAEANPLIDRCAFTNNGPTHIEGAGLYVSTLSSATIINCLFANNEEDGNAAIRSYSPITLLNTTFANNKQLCSSIFPSACDHAWYLPAVRIHQNSVVRNCVFSGNRDHDGNISDIYAVDGPRLEYCATEQFYGNSDHSLQCATCFMNPTTSPGRIWTGTGTANGLPADYRLCPTACVIDQGNNGLLYAGTLTDLFGEPRVSNGRVDMGCSEYICTNCPPVILSHPSNQTLAEGAQLSLSAVAGGTDPLSYQWYKAGVALVNGGRVSGATTPNLNIANLVVSDSGGYCMAASNVWGETPSATATLVVTAPVHLFTPCYEVVMVRRPEFSWIQPNPPATWFHLRLNRNGINYFNTWISNGLTHWTPTADLPGGTYTWSVQPWNAQGYGGLADTCAFVVRTNPPGPVTLIAPIGGQRVASAQPVFSWSTASPPASWYHLWINRNNRKYYDTWTQNTNWTPSWYLAAGAYSWWVQTWNADGLGPWSAKGDFIVGLPGPVTLLSPINGALETNLIVRYTWTAEPTADWYELAIVRNGASFSDRWFSSMHTASNTPAGQFAVEVSGHASGAYRWWVRAWNTNGLSSWVGPGSFTNTLSVTGIKRAGDTRQPGDGDD